MMVAGFHLYCQLSEHVADHGVRFFVVGGLK